MVSIYFLSLTILTSTFADKDTLPVFLLDYDHSLAHVQIDPNPLSKLSSASFASILKSATTYSEGVIIFVEETFCVEDISLKDSSGSPFDYLHQSLPDKSVKYFPAIQDSFKTLTDSFPPKVYNQFWLKLGVPLALGDLKYIYVYFEDDRNEPRCSVLRKHDLLMKEVYFMFRQSKPGPVVAFYTGKVNPSVVTKIGNVPKKTEDSSVKIASTAALFKFTGVFATTTKSRRSMFSQKPTVAEETWTRRKLSTKMAYINFEMQFNFTFGKHGWVLDNVGLLEEGEEVGRTEMAVGAPWRRSFVCSDPLVIVNTRDGSSITISKYQVEPRISTQETGQDSEALDDQTNTTDKSSDKFGEPVNCGPYFSTAILSCLGVSFLCLAILFYGIVSLFDIHTNDRFDDPLSKQLVLVER